MATDFPVGLCILGSRCHNPTGQLRPAHRCPACEEICHPVTCSFLKEHYVTKKGEKLDDVYLCADCTAGRSHVPLDATEATPTQDNETPQEEEARKRKANEMSQPSPPPYPAPDTPNTPRTRNSTRMRANEKPKASATKKPKSVRFRPGLRVKIQRQHLYHVINNEFQRKAIPRSHGNTYQYYGTIVKRGTRRRHWKERNYPLDSHAWYFLWWPQGDSTILLENDTNIHFFWLIAYLYNLLLINHA